MALIDTVKIALRINHDYLDDDLEETIAAAQAELVRVGVDETIAASETDSLIVAAVKTYCGMVYNDDPKIKEGFMTSWQYQLENLRRSTGYMVEEEDDE